eukprot:175386-Prymnesium_polylepis.1
MEYAACKPPPGFHCAPSDLTGIYERMSALPLRRPEPALDLAGGALRGNRLRRACLAARARRGQTLLKRAPRRGNHHRRRPAVRFHHGPQRRLRQVRVRDPKRGTLRGA